MMHAWSFNKFILFIIRMDYSWTSVTIFLFNFRGSKEVESRQGIKGTLIASQYKMYLG